MTGFPVIFVVGTPLIRTCPVTLAPPQARVALTKAGQSPLAGAGPPISIAAFPQALEGGV